MAVSRRADDAFEGVVIEPDALRSFARDILQAVGARTADAEIVAEHMVTANSMGHDSHGVVLLEQYVRWTNEGKIRPDNEITVDHDGGAVVVLDGGFGYGQAIARHAAGLAVERARAHGISSIFCRNNNHIGRLGEFTEIVAEAGLAAVMFSNGQGGQLHVAPHGGYGRRLTNNPVSLAAPSAGKPVVHDMALSTVAGGKVLVAQARGEEIAEGLLLDADGHPSTDPNKFYTGGALTPLGGHKGYGLILLTEILVGILSRGGVSREDDKDFSNAFQLIAIDIEPIVGLDDFAADVEALRAFITDSPRHPDTPEILFPGDIERATAEQRNADGIAIEDSTWEVILGVAADAGVEPPG